MWQCWRLIFSVVLGAFDTVHVGIPRLLDIVLGHHNLQHLQKTVLESAWILRRVMFCLDSQDLLSVLTRNLINQTYLVEHKGVLDDKFGA